MYDNLKERLTDMSVLASTRTPADALKYIEKLEDKLAEYKHVASAIDTQWAESQDEIADLKDKLAKAVELETVKILVTSAYKEGWSDGTEFISLDVAWESSSTRTTLAELSSVSCANTTGGKDE